MKPFFFSATAAMKCHSPVVWCHKTLRRSAIIIKNLFFAEKGPWKTHISAMIYMCMCVSHFNHHLETAPKRSSMISAVNMILWDRWQAEHDLREKLREQGFWICLSKNLNQETVHRKQRGECTQTAACIQICAIRILWVHTGLWSF